jgi:hypothetical protein
MASFRQRNVRTGKTSSAKVWDPGKTLGEGLQGSEPFQGQISILRSGFLDRQLQGMSAVLGQPGPSHLPLAIRDSQDIATHTSPLGTPLMALTVKNWDEVQLAYVRAVRETNGHTKKS